MRHILAPEGIIGFSKLPQLVRLLARRCMVQGYMGRPIADTLETLLVPHGVDVYLEAYRL